MSGDAETPRPRLAIEEGAFALAGVKVGHAGDPGALTGVTALLFESGARAAVDVRGGAPGTRESAALDPLSLVPAIHGLVFTGGSAFGLDAAGGVVAWLEERGIGFRTPEAAVPIVPAAVIYDLRLGRGRVRPDAAMGRRAAEAAREEPFAEGSVGAGAGATVGKLRGRAGMMRGGLGAARARVAGGFTVGAIAVVNALGDVVDPASGRILAGTRAPAEEGGGFADSVALFAEARGSPVENTTLVAVLTDAPLSKAALGRVARMAHDGIGRAVRPAHTQWDGDVDYAISTAAAAAGGPAPDEPPAASGPSVASAVGAAAPEVVARAIVRAVLLAADHPDAPSARSYLRSVS